MENFKFVFFFLLISSSCFASGFKFYQEKVKSIEIRRRMMYYQFDSLGTTVFRDFVFKIPLSSYSVKLNKIEYERVDCVTSFKLDSKQVSKTKLSYSSDSNIKDYLVISLLKNLENGCSIADSDSFLKEYSRLTTENNLRSCLQSTDLDYFYYEIKFDKSEDLLRSIQNIDTFKYIIKNNCGNHLSTYVTDYADELYIIVNTTKTKYAFVSRYPDRSRCFWKEIETEKGYFITSIEISSLLKCILPSSFIPLESLNECSFIEDYIRLFIRHKKKGATKF